MTILPIFFILTQGSVHFRFLPGATKMMGLGLTYPHSQSLQGRLPEMKVKVVCRWNLSAW